MKKSKNYIFCGQVISELDVAKIDQDKMRKISEKVARKLIDEDIKYQRCWRLNEPKPTK